MKTGRPKSPSKKSQSGTGVKHRESKIIEHMGRISERISAPMRYDRFVHSLVCDRSKAVRRRTAASRSRGKRCFACLRSLPRPLWKRKACRRRAVLRPSGKVLRFGALCTGAGARTPFSSARPSPSLRASAAASPSPATISTFVSTIKETAYSVKRLLFFLPKNLNKQSDARRGRGARFFPCFRAGEKAES